MSDKHENEIMPDWMPERPTKKQRAWQPNMPSKPRSTFVMLTSSILLLEASLVFFATLATWGLTQKFFSGNQRSFALIPVDESMRPWVLMIGIFLSILLAVTCAFMTKPWGVVMGWIDQVLIIATGIIMIPMFYIGLLFAFAWWYAVRTGRRIDSDDAKIRDVIKS